MKLWKKLLIIILFLIAILSILVVRKFIIISNLANRAKEYANKTNYYTVVQSLQNGIVNMVKSYNKDGNQLTSLKVYRKDLQEERSVVMYEKDGEQIGIVQSGDNKVAILNNSLFVAVNPVNEFSLLENSFQKLQFAVMSSITTDNYNDTECYLIERDNVKMWVEKDTGLILRSIDAGSISEKFYEFDVVKDEDIIQPDISDCMIQE